MTVKKRPPTVKRETLDQTVQVEPPQPTEEELARQRSRMNHQVAVLAQASVFIAALGEMQKVLHSWNVAQGFWPDGKDKNFGEVCALIHSEVSEALEGNRTGAMSDKIPDFRAEEEELADALIRVLDAAGGYNLRVGEALIRKTLYNLNRPPKHGKRY